jgi:hypothetical protein
MGCLCLTFLEEYLLEHGCSPDGVPHTKPAPVRVPETPARWGIPGGVLVLANRQPYARRYARSSHQIGINRPTSVRFRANRTLSRYRRMTI